MRAVFCCTFFKNHLVDSIERDLFMQMYLYKTHKLVEFE